MHRQNKHTSSITRRAELTWVKSSLEVCFICPTDKAAEYFSVRGVSGGMELLAKARAFIEVAKARLRTAKAQRTGADFRQRRK